MGSILGLDRTVNSSETENNIKSYSKKSTPQNMNRELIVSIVIIELVSILLILPQRFLCFLKVSSFIASVEKRSFSQLSVSAHSLRAISNFECISARLCGYCASLILAYTLEEDFLIWNTTLESNLFSLHSFTMLTANCSLYSISKFFFILSPQSTHSVVYNHA